MIPVDCSVSVIAAEFAESRQHLIGQKHAVVLWDVAAENLGTLCERITKTAVESPDVLQIAAVTELTVGEQAVLSELGVVVMIRHPEELTKLAKMIRRYLAS